jgi:serine/threonine protein kinase
VGFEVEQMIMPRLTGPHVPRLIGSGDFEVMPYIVTEKIDGGSLLPCLPETAPLPLSDADRDRRADGAMRWHDLHKQHVIHLDLKPENFLQRPTGEMVLHRLRPVAPRPELARPLAEEFTIPMGTFPISRPNNTCAAATTCAATCLRLAR